MKFTREDIRNLGTILGVWAHPDDESWCAAGIMAAAVSNNQRVVCVTATPGDAGVTSDETRWPTARLGEIRQRELEASLEIIGVTEHIWLDYPDGQLQSADSTKAVAQLLAIIQDVQPDTILTFGPDGLTGHPDHIAIYDWTKQALKQSGLPVELYSVIELTEVYESAVTKACDERFNIYFNIDTPRTVPTSDADLLFELEPELQETKLRSLNAHQCQMDRMINDPAGQAYMRQLSLQEAFIKERV